MSRRPPLAPLVVFGLAGCGQFGLQMVDSTVDGHLNVQPAGETDFGARYPGKQGAMATFELAPIGQDNAVEVDDVWVEGDTGAFSIPAELPLPRTLDPGVEFSVRVRFAPEDVGTFTGQLVAVTNVGDEVRRDLRGVGCRDKDDNGHCD